MSRGFVIFSAGTGLGRMPQHQRKVSVQGREVVDLASILSRLLDEHGWNQTEFARRVKINAEFLHSKYPHKGFKQIYIGAPNKVRERFTSILLARPHSDNKSLSDSISWNRMAKEVYLEELEVYAYTLEVHLPWLTCTGKSSTPLDWDPEDEDNKPEHLEYMLKIYERMAGEMCIFARSLPGFLTSEELMYIYHELVFDSRFKSKKRAPIYKFSAIENRRREWLLKPERIRTSEFTVILLHSDLQELVNGRGFYAKIGKKQRRECLDRLKELALDSSKKIKISVAVDDRHRSILKGIRNCDYVIVCGDVFCLERDHNWGVKYWVGRSDKTVSSCSWIKSFIQRSQYNTPEQIELLLNRLISELR